VLGNGRKLAGILLESGEDSGSRWLAIGIGVNLASSPEGTEFPATSLAQLGIAAPSSQDALTVLAARFAHWYDVWMNEGFGTVRAAWLARAGGLGKSIQARLPNATHQGVFEGIDSTGALLLNEQGRVRAIAAGEVFF
jgi:BirA family transcriptional regulator, biotin operon repressor / biotin---[acetyl-CoA-carboxylase] ligase